MKNLKVIVCIIILFAGCKKKTEPSFYKISDEIKSYGDFKIGSYWIYKNDSLNIEDSIYVDNYTFRIDETIPNISTGRVESRYEVLSCECKNLQLTHNLNYDARGFDDYLTIIERDLTKNIMWNINFFNSNPTENIENIIVKNIDTITIFNTKYNNIIYQKTIVTTYDYHNGDGINTIHTKDTTEYWLAKNVGVIKRIVKNSYYREEWNLLRYNVVQ